MTRERPADADDADLSGEPSPPLAGTDSRPAPDLNSVWRPLFSGLLVAGLYVGLAARLGTTLAPETIGGWLTLGGTLVALAVGCTLLYDRSGRRSAPQPMRLRIREIVGLGVLVAGTTVGSQWALRPLAGPDAGGADPTVAVVAAVIGAIVLLASIVDRPGIGWSTVTTREREAYLVSSDAYRIWLENQRKWFHDGSHAAERGSAAIDEAMAFLTRADDRIRAGDERGFLLYYANARRNMADIYDCLDRVAVTGEGGPKRAGSAETGSPGGDETEATADDQATDAASDETAVAPDSSAASGTETTDGIDSPHLGETAGDQVSPDDSELVGFVRLLELEAQSLPRGTQANVESLLDVTTPGPPRPSLRNVRRAFIQLQNEELASIERETSIEQQLTLWNGFVAGLTLVLGIVIAVGLGPFQQPGGTEPASALVVVTVAVSGMLGAAVSSLQNWRSVSERTESEASGGVSQLLPPETILVQLAVSRLLIGAVAALTFYVALLGGLVVPAGMAEADYPLVLLLAFGAGFLERLFPSTLSEVLRQEAVTESKTEEASRIGTDRAGAGSPSDR
ncbi:hypothetical protein Halru_0892 [Halovivax ruber XH-70]|uniref:Uncharacterized protein n=1 Tax=Halovivax ruber (strain DSM 18193 / JCM 13892 / XH-70) TaxID=797302 RepID=L0IB96_HALRX|nr:hypothetical protein [Halovivax ruber]AGB15516.1 hypothetical protein Halru_0892 [Halovivax ruber XH-70]